MKLIEYLHTELMENKVYLGNKMAGMEMDWIMNASNVILVLKPAEVGMMDRVACPVFTKAIDSDHVEPAVLIAITHISPEFCRLNPDTL
jgi:hypothetical protein